MGEAGMSPQRKPRDRTVAEIEKLARQRANRRKSAEEFKKRREHEIRQNEKRGTPGDVDFQRMIRRFRKYEMQQPCDHEDAGQLKINVVVRKRPVSESEVARKDFDSVSCSNPRVYVHNCKLKVDGITKVLSNLSFVLDHAFHESVPNEEVYNHTAKYLVEFAVGGGRATCFAYGQTGSGKTYTMAGVQALAARDVFDLVRSPEHRDKQLEVHCAFFELYGGRCMDLLHDRRVCSIREDGKGRVQIEGLGEIVVSDEDELLELIDRGNRCRTTHATEMNADSSRSHAICQIALRPLSAREGSEPYGKLSLIDLAGSERGQDTKHHNRQRRQESAEINKSLLALKECIRALDSGSAHVPYRASKLTMVLKDSFSVNARTVMISCISPIASSSDHTVNTLRYADRVKEKVVRAAELQVAPVRRIGDADPTLDSLSEEDLSAEDDDGGLDEEDDMDLDEPPSARRSASPMSSEDPASARRGAATGRKMANPRNTPAKAPVPVQSPARSVSRARRQPESARKPRIPALQQQQQQPSRATPARSASKPPAPRRQWDEPSDPRQHQLQQHQHQHDQQFAATPSTALSRASGNQSKSPSPVERGANLSREVSFHDVVSQLVDMEEELLSAHMQAIQKNADLLTEEGVLLSKVQGSEVVDYDIDEYASRLDDIISSKIKLFSDLQGTLKRFRKHLALEEVAARVIAED